MTNSTAATEAPPGIAANMPETTRRIEGIAVTSRMILSTRSARSTDSGPDAGSSAMPTTITSNTFHGSRNIEKRMTANLSAISRTKMPRQIMSSVCSNCIVCGETSVVIAPRMTALIRMTVMMKRWKRGLFISLSMLAMVPPSD